MGGVGGVTCGSAGFGVAGMGARGFGGTLPGPLRLGWLRQLIIGLM